MLRHRIRGIACHVFYLDSMGIGIVKIDIIHAVKYILAKIQIEKGVNMCNACYDCKYRNSVPGSAHSYCSNPVALAIGDEYGIKSGWFFHPLNFDPTWLRYCDGFEKEKQD